MTSKARSTITRLAGLAAVTVTAVGALYVLPGTDWAAAQAPPVTAPCDDPQCGPNPPAPGNEAKAFSFGNFYCDPVKGISVTVGVGRRGVPTTFAVTITGGLDKEMFIGPVQPGTSVTTATFAVPSGHVQVTTSTDGTPFANPIPNRQLPTVRSFPITCECDDDQPTTTTATTTPDTTPSGSTTTPASSTSTPTPSGSTAPTVTLPATGNDTATFAWVAVIAIAAGLGLLLLTRRAATGNDR